MFYENVLKDVLEDLHILGVSNHLVQQICNPLVCAFGRIAG